METVSAGGMNEYWRQLESLGTALLTVLTPVGRGAGAVHESAAIVADSREVCLPKKVSSKQTLEPALNVLSSSVITGEGSSEHTRRAYHTIDGLQSISIMDRQPVRGRGRLPVRVR